MENFFLTGAVPPRWSTHIDCALEKSPPMLFEKAIAAYQQPIRKLIRESLRGWASTHHLHVPEEFGLA